MGQLVNVSIEGTIATVVIDNPPLNALNIDTLNAIYRAFRDMEESGQDIRAVIITGAGEKAFVAGADINEFPDCTSETYYIYNSRGQRAFTRVENFKAPVIAAINGFALGGGLELALACDIRIASEKARMGFPEVGLGVLPGYAGTQRLGKTINIGDAKKMIYTAKPVKPEEALRLGLVQSVVPHEQLMDEAKALALAIAENGPIAVAAAKRSINYLHNMFLEQGMWYEREQFGALSDTEDKAEGVDAFMNKRKPVFHNK